MARDDHALAQKHVSNGFDRRRHRVDDREPLPAVWNLRERVDHRRRVQPELDQEAAQQREVSVFRRQGREPEPDAEAECRDLQHQERQPDDGSRKPELRTTAREVLEIEPEAQKRDKLQAKRQGVGEDDRQGDDQTWEIHLAKNAGIVDERRGRVLESLRKIVPTQKSSEIEQHRWQPIRRDLDSAGEHDREYQGREQRLKYEPGRSENRLFVLRHEVAIDQQKQKVAIAPNLAEIQTKPTARRANDQFVIRGRVKHDRDITFGAHVDHAGVPGRALRQLCARARHPFVNSPLMRVVRRCL
jgi:hypothetical protein